MTPAPFILVVDDEPSARETMEALLFADHYELQSVASAQEAIELLGRRLPDCVLCDVMMPTMDGFALCRHIRAHAEWRFIPLILVTALDGQDDMVRGIDAGADDFLSKPINRVVLRARVRAMIQIRSRYQELQARGRQDLAALQRERRERIVDTAGLTEREREILDLILLGQGHEDIGTALAMSPRTVKHHQSRILQKLNAESRIDLLRIFA